MKILVTGASGFIGWHLCKALVGQGHRVVGTQLTATNVSPQYEIMRIRELVHSGVELVNCNLADSAAIAQLKEVKDIGAVVHLAAKPGVRFRRDEVPDYADSNLLALSRVLDFVRDQGVPKFVFASSSTVYESLSGRDEFSEDDVLSTPSNFYGLTKLIGEHTVEAILSKTDVSYTMARFFSVYGPLGRSDMAYQRAINSALKGDPFKLTGDGLQLRDFTYVEDAVHVLEQVLLSDFESGPLNIGGGKPRSILDLLGIVEKVTGKQVHLVPTNSATQNNEIAKTNASSALLESRGFETPNTSLEEGVEKTIRANELLESTHAPHL